MARRGALGTRHCLPIQQVHLSFPPRTLFLLAHLPFLILPSHRCFPILSLPSILPCLIPPNLNTLPISLACSNSSPITKSLSSRALCNSLVNLCPLPNLARQSKFKTLVCSVASTKKLLPSLAKSIALFNSTLLVFLPTIIRSFSSPYTLKTASRSNGLITWRLLPLRFFTTGQDLSMNSKRSSLTHV